MPTVRVTSGVSVKIPVVIRRVERWDADGDVAAKLVAWTALEWRDETRPDDDSNKRQVPSHGRVRIPSRCLREIIDKHKGFASRICWSPVVVNVDVSVNDDNNKDNKCV